MAWRLIGNQRYFYRSERRGAKVVSIYEPAQFGAAWAKILASRRRERALEREALLFTKRWAEASEGAAREYLAEVHKLVGLVMVGSGHHRCDRSRWRKRRMGAIGQAKVKAPAPGRETERLLERAGRGEEDTYPQVRALLEDPEGGRSFSTACTRCPTSSG